MFLSSGSTWESSTDPCAMSGIRRGDAQGEDITSSRTSQGRNTPTPYTNFWSILWEGQNRGLAQNGICAELRKFWGQVEFFRVERMNHTAKKKEGSYRANLGDSISF
jgi:hypothetical protein